MNDDVKKCEHKCWTPDFPTYEFLSQVIGHHMTCLGPTVSTPNSDEDPCCLGFAIGATGRWVNFHVYTLRKYMKIWLVALQQWPKEWSHGTFDINSIARYETWALLSAFGRTVKLLDIFRHLRSSHAIPWWFCCKWYFHPNHKWRPQKNGPQ